MNKHWTVYMYTFPDGKRYIGATSKTLSQRQGHEFKRYKPCKKLWAAIQEAGYQNIKQEILFEGDVEPDVAGEYERYFIELYQTNDPELGYNVGAGGVGLVNERHYTDEYKKRRDDMIRCIGYAGRGRHHSDESKAKMRAAKVGKKRGPLSDETKAKISHANSRENMSEETRRRHSRAASRPVIATEKTTGEQMTFARCLDAAEYFGVTPPTFSNWLHGKSNPTVNYSFEFQSANND